MSGNITYQKTERRNKMISVGIDVSKGKSMVCILKPGGEVLEPPFEILHTMESVSSLVRQIKEYDEEVKVVLENTGYYHWPIITTLVEEGVFVCVVNALRMKKFCSQNIRRAKTDRIDSISIAQFGITYWSELTQVLPSQDIYQELRLLARQYYQETSMLIKARVNFSNLCDQAMPGIQSILCDNKGNHKLTDFVAHYKHSENILKMSETRFTSNYCKWAQKKGYRNCEQTAPRIYAAIQNGIPVLPNSLSTTIVMTEAIRVLHEIELSRKTILTQMQELAKTLPEYQTVLDMKCIGETLAPRLIAEIGDIRKYHNKHSLIAYAGIDAPPYQSGTFNATERHISKRGNRYLRKTGFEVMQSYIQHKPDDEPVYAFIEKKRNEGKCGKEAMIAGLNKFLRIYYGRVSEVYRNIDEQLTSSVTI